MCLCVCVCFCNFRIRTENRLNQYICRQASVRANMYEFRAVERAYFPWTGTVSVCNQPETSHFSCNQTSPTTKTPMDVCHRNFCFTFSDKLDNGPSWQHLHNIPTITWTQITQYSLPSSEFNVAISIAFLCQSHTIQFFGVNKKFCGSVECIKRLFFFLDKMTRWWLFQSCNRLNNRNNDETCHHINGCRINGKNILPADRLCHEKFASLFLSLPRKMEHIDV